MYLGLVHVHFHLPRICAVRGHGVYDLLVCTSVLRLMEMVKTAHDIYCIAPLLRLVLENRESWLAAEYNICI